MKGLAQLYLTPGTWQAISKPVPAPPTFLGWVLHLVPTGLQYLPWPLVGVVGSRCQLSQQPDLIWGKELEATDLERNWVFSFGVFLPRLSPTLGKGAGSGKA